MSAFLDQIEGISLDFANTLYPLHDEHHEKTMEAIYQEAVKASKNIKDYHILRTKFLEVRERQFRENKQTLVDNDFFERVSLALQSVLEEKFVTKDLVQKAQDAYAKAFIDSMICPKDNLEILTELSKRFRGNIIVCSNFIRSDAVRVPLIRDGIAKHLKEIIVSCEIGYIKPHPLIFEKIKEVLGLQSSNICHVGDDWEADIIGAGNNGMKSIYTKEHRTDPDPYYGQKYKPLTEINRLSDLLNL
jgi:FMN phosphatase YigB (HAD superfamily)